MPPKKAKRSPRAFSPSTSSIPSNELDMLIEAIGLCGVNGYGNETGHCVHLSKMFRTDTNILYTASRALIRLEMAATFGQYDWFKMLYDYTDPKDIVEYRGLGGHTLYYFVSSLCTWDGDLAPANEFDRIKIFRLLEAVSYEEYDEATKTKCTVSLDMNLFNNECDEEARYYNYMQSVKDEPDNYALVKDYYQAYPIPFLAAIDNNLLNLADEYLKHCPSKLDLNGEYGLLDYSIVHILVCLYPHRTSLIEKVCAIPAVEIDLPESKDDHTPLMIAVNQGSKKTVKVLLKYVPDRVNVNRCPNELYSPGYSVLHKAILRKKFGCVQLLCANPYTDLNLENQPSNDYINISRDAREDIEIDTPLTLAIRHENAKSFHELLKYYPERLQLPDNDSCNNDDLLFRACDAVSTEYLETLCSIESVNLKVRMDQYNGYEDVSVLTYCALQSKIDKLKILLRYDPERIGLNETNKYGRTVLDQVREYEEDYDPDSEIIELLIDAGAKKGRKSASMKE